MGDSHAYLCRKQSVVCLTEEHKLTNPSERKRVIEMGIKLAPKADRIHGLAVSRALGDHFLKNEKQGVIEIPHLTKPIQLRNDDKFLIVASDGVKFFIYIFFFIIFFFILLIYIFFFFFFY